MPLTYNKYLKAQTIDSAKIKTKTTMWFTTLMSIMLITFLIVVLSPATIQAKELMASKALSANQYDLKQYLTTQTVLIRTLPHYINALEQKINIIKSKTNEIKTINDFALTDVHKYVNNPLNALTILKRLTSDWQILQQYAHNFDITAEIVGSLASARKSLKFPSESDFDDAVTNLLRIQDIYKLKPERLAAGEVNGIKLGSVMSWSDCLEIGRKSVQNGDFMMGKFWMEVALGKLPNEGAIFALMANVSEEVVQVNDSNGEVDNARQEIKQALIKAELKMGNLDVALDMVNGMLQKHPKSKYLRKAKNQIKNDLRKYSGRLNKKLTGKNKGIRSDKSVEESLIEEICRETANIGAATEKATHYTDDGSQHNLISHKKYCRFLNGNLPELLLQPLQVEILNIDPYVVIYHNVLRTKEIDDLQELIDEHQNYVDFSATKFLKFTNLAQKKLAGNIAKRLQIATGHASKNFAKWQVERWTHEDDYVYADTLVPMSNKIIANVLFNLRKPKLGGAIAFPQLEFGVFVPQNALLYWTQLNEYHEYDYRSKQHVCPVIAGMQLMAFTNIRVFH
ncbi:prolyl 4-hydroxylase subunit alpha-2 [Eurosta solidaginis]|uniref:prolyl 4-hydroxylase subunit alpha-2 n=1 Tax=Eurosta solidaginis TaxID=178769 RepID=UPI0035317B9D